MCRLDIFLAVVLVPFHVISTAELHPASDETTQSNFQNYDTQNSDELFDPMKQTYKTYEDFVSAGSRRNLLMELSRASTQPIRPYLDEETTIIAFDVDATTMKPEEITSFYAVNAANDINSSTMDDPSPQPLMDISNASDLSSIKQAKMIVSQPAEHPEHLAQLHAENEGDEVAALAMYSRNDTEDEYIGAFDIDGDESKDESAVTPFVAATTTESAYSYTASIAPSPITTTMNIPLAVTTTTQTAAPTTTAPITTTMQTVTIPTTIYSKKPKKIDTPTRFFKYSADEILRQYLEDIHIRAPLATLINTSPNALRKAKQLWTSTLRTNSPIDIVLVAFNSSGKTRTREKKDFFLLHWAHSTFLGPNSNIFSIQLKVFVCSIFDGVS